MGKKQAKFFCENCGAEVGQNSRLCTQCGRFFAAVRCPACGKTGSSNAFIKGCPSCGYAGKKNDIAAEKSGSSNKADGKGHFFFHKKNGNGSRGFKLRQSRQPAKESSLPGWIYALTFSVFILVIAFFANLLIRM